MKLPKSLQDEFTEYDDNFEFTGSYCSMDTEKFFMAGALAVLNSKELKGLVEGLNHYSDPSEYRDRGMGVTNEDTAVASLKTWQQYLEGE